MEGLLLQASMYLGAAVLIVPLAVLGRYEAAQRLAHRFGLLAAGAAHGQSPIPRRHGPRGRRFASPVGMACLFVAQGVQALGQVNRVSPDSLLPAMASG